jgi:predicted GNAT family N-acyltransferase
MRVLTPQLFEEVYAMFDYNFPNEIKITKKELHENLFSDTYKMLLLTLNDEIIGAFIYNPIISIPNCMFIEYIFIKKEYQNKGYGKKFIQNCLDKLSYKYVMLDCQKNLISYYEKLDFYYVNKCKYNANGVCLYLMCFTHTENMIKYWIDHL